MSQEESKEVLMNLNSLDKVHNRIRNGDYDPDDGPPSRNYRGQTILDLYELSEELETKILASGIDNVEILIELARRGKFAPILAKQIQKQYE